MRTRRAALIALMTVPVVSVLVGGAVVAMVAAADSADPASSKPRLFNRVLIRPLRVEYTPEFKVDGARPRRRIQDEDLERVRRYYHEIVEQKLAPGFEAASESGPGVVLVEGVLLDHWIDKHDWNTLTRLNFRGAPEVRVVMFLHDSETGEVIDTIGLTLGPQPGRLMISSPGSYWDFMQKVFDRLATRALWSLEDQNS
jgi:hypothetical protein